MEDEGEVTVCVEVVSGQLNGFIELILTTSDDSAVGNGREPISIALLISPPPLTEDYTSTYMDLTIHSRCTCVTLDQLIIDDDIFESDTESFNINLLTHDGTVISSISVTITDNDGWSYIMPSITVWTFSLSYFQLFT